MTEPTRYEQSEDVDLETPENDAAEQQRSADYDDYDDERAADRASRREAPLEADPADAAEQDQDAGVDEDDYR